MRLRPTFPRLLGTCLLACVVAMLWSAPAGLAIGTPSIGGGSPQYTAATAATIGWSAVGPDPGYDAITYEGDLSGAAFSTAGTSTGVTFGSPGTYTFRVRAVETDSLNLLPPVTGAYGVATIVVDRTPPTISCRPLAGGSQRRQRLVHLALDQLDLHRRRRPGDLVPRERAIPDPRRQPDAVGRGDERRRANQLAQVTTPIFNFDAAAPRQATLRQPTPRATVTSEPTFVWAPPTRGTETSGYNRYEVWARIAGTYRKKSPSCPSSRDRPSTARRATRPCRGPQ